MTYRDLYLRLNDLAGQPAGGDFETLGKMYINFVYFRLLDLGRVRHESRTFELVTVADTYEYGLPLYVRRVESVVDSTNEKNIYTASTREIDVDHPAYDATGTPRKAYPIRSIGVERQPVAQGKLSLVSTNTLDSGASFKLIIVGMRYIAPLVSGSSRILTRETVNMTGTVAVETTNSYETVERLVKSVSSTAFAGKVQVSDAAGNELAYIPPWWDSPDYLWLAFYPIPDAAVTYKIRAEMRKPPLVEDTDWPEIEQDYHDLIVLGAAVDLLPKVGMTNAAMVLRKTFEDRMREYLSRQKDEFDVARCATFEDVSIPRGGIKRPRFEI